tara:strand:+ start:303 stop:494 length:192 start_codon:yes stop_codon:yes gene_type:complete
MQYLKEVTDWGSYTYVPNHTYIVNDAGQLMGIIPQGKTEAVMYKKPMKQFSKARRKFIKIEVK